MSRFYALAQRPWVEDDGGGHWGLPPGTIGAVDLAPVNGRGHVFVTSDKPFDPADAATAIGDGTRLDSYVPSIRERSDWQSLIGVAYQPGWTLLDLLWATLTTHADPDGIARTKPIRPNHKGVLELHLGGHSLVRSEKLPEDPTTLPFWPVLQRSLQNGYRKILADEGVVRAQKWLGHEQRRYRMTPERTSDLFIPAGLPRVLPVPPTTTIGDTFTNTDHTLLASHTATGPNGGHSWENVKATASRILSNEADILLNSATRTAADGALSSDDHYVQGRMRSASGFTWRGLAARFSASANTSYLAAYDIQSNKIFLYRIVAGSATQITNFDRTYAIDDVVRLICDGSTISVEVNDSEVISVTDTNITGNLRTGFNELAAAGSSAQIDDFEAADLTAGGGEALVRAIDEALGLTGARRRLLVLARSTAETEGAAEATARPRARARRRAETQGIAEGDVVARALARLRNEAVDLTETTASIVEAIAEAVVRVVSEIIAMAETATRPRRLARIPTQLVGIADAVARVGGVVSAAVPAITSRIRMRVGPSTRLNVPPARRLGESC